MALHRHFWTLIDRATSKSQQRRNVSISLLELAPGNFFVRWPYLFLLYSRSFFLLTSFGEIAVLYWVFQLLFARPRSHNWIWRRSRVEAGGRIHQKTLELPSQIPSLLAALIRKSWGCSTLYGTFAILPSFSLTFLDTWLSFFWRDTSSSHLMLQVGGSNDCGSGLPQWILRCHFRCRRLLQTQWGGTNFHHM